MSDIPHYLVHVAPPLQVAEIPGIITWQAQA
jgi:hypothetical protein